MAISPDLKEARAISTRRGQGTYAWYPGHAWRRLDLQVTRATSTPDFVSGPGFGTAIKAPPESEEGWIHKRLDYNIQL